MVTSMPYPQPDISAEGLLLILEARRGLGEDRVFAIDLPGEGAIGLCGAHLKGSEVEIGYWLGRPYWGRGYGTQAARAVTSIAHDLDAGPVIAGHFTDNPASGRVLEKAGFVYTGEVTPRFSLARRGRVATRMMEHRA